MAIKPGKERIKLNMNVEQVIVTMCDNTIGAVSVLSQVMKHADLIDPNNMPHGLGFMLICDSYGIYGSDIWMLYKDACQEDIGKMMLAVRATQLGFITESQLKASFGGRYHKERDSEGELVVTEQYTFDVEDLLNKVQGVTEFNIEARAD